MTKKKNKIFTLFFLFLVSAFQVGCATLGGTTQPIAIDSEPRGLSLALNAKPRSDDPFTPMASTIERDSHLQFTYHVDIFQKLIRSKCNVRYGTVFAGNVPIAMLALAQPVVAALLYGSLVGVDFATGAAFECPYFVRHNIELPSALEDQLHHLCRRILLMPPETNADVTLASALLNEAKAFASRSNKECVEFVSPMNASDALSRSSLSGLEVKNLFGPEMKRKLSQLLRDTAAHQAVELKVARRTQRLISVQFSLWDLYSGQVISSFEKSFSNEKFEKLKGGVGSWVLGQSVKIVPNSIALLGSRPVLTLNKDISVNQKPIGGSSSIFGLLTATSVQHPDQYDAWDADFQFGPSFYFDSLRNEIELQVNRKFEAEDKVVSAPIVDLQRREYRAYALNIPFDAIASLHTPAGAFRAFVGYGLASYLPTSSSSPDHSIKFYGVGHFGLDWVAYMSDNLFFQFGFHGFSRGDDVIEQQGPYALSGWTSVLLGVGYYFPGSQGLIESIVTNR